MLVSVNAANTGLSPLARGTHILQNTRLISTRFIPAGAGNTCKYYLVPIIGTVYPRWRGEHVRLMGLKNTVSGLSPLARGTPPSRRSGYAGIAVYPRWRGEHVDLHGKDTESYGLSPLARGTPRFFALYRFRARFIPAGAGNTC